MYVFNFYVSAVAAYILQNRQYYHNIAIIIIMLQRGTGIRGLMRGMATLPQGYQELLVVTDKVGRPTDELEVSKSMECDIFPSVI